MAKLLFRLNNVEFDEAEAVRELLLAHEFSFYETQAGMFGFSLAGIWLQDASQYETARALLDDFAAERAASFRQALAHGESPSFWQNFWRRPVASVIIIAAIVGVLYFSVWPFLQIGQ